mmetsp:Transcript_66226/g.181573  ORF Transcript_66226/g.181573 Transcript_66226/m.181573 type:complete len:247 (-) Transcript_66226:250-990(-)
MLRPVGQLALAAAVGLLLARAAHVDRLECLRAHRARADAQQVRHAAAAHPARRRRLGRACRLGRRAGPANARLAARHRRRRSLRIRLVRGHRGRDRIRRHCRRRDTRARRRAAHRRLLDAEALARRRERGALLGGCGRGLGAGRRRHEPCRRRRNFGGHRGHRRRLRQRVGRGLSERALRGGRQRRVRQQTQALKESHPARSSRSCAGRVGRPVTAAGALHATRNAGGGRGRCGGRHGNGRGCHWA